jgi:hypothetical protein
MKKISLLLPIVLVASALMPLYAQDMAQSVISDFSVTVLDMGIEDDPELGIEIDNTYSVSFYIDQPETLEQIFILAGTGYEKGDLFIEAVPVVSKDGGYYLEHKNYFYAINNGNVALDITAHPSKVSGLRYFSVYAKDKQGAFSEKLTMPMY